MNLTLRHVAWAFGLVVGAIIGVFLAPAWEMAPFVIGPYAAILGGISSQCAVFRGRLGLVLAVAVTLLGGGVFAMDAKAHGLPKDIVQQCTAALILSGLSGAIIGELIKRKTR